MAQILTESELEYCGCCGSHHRPAYCGDCRNDKERYVEADEDKDGNPLYVAASDFDFSKQAIRTTPKSNTDQPRKPDKRCFGRIWL